MLAPELIHELRRLLRHADRLKLILFACCALLLLQVAWLRSGRNLSPLLPAASDLAIFFSMHVWMLSQQGLSAWMRSLDQRVGSGTAWALLEAARLEQGSSGLAQGRRDSLEAYAKTKPARASGPWALRGPVRITACVVPLLLFMGAAMVMKHSSASAWAFGLGGFVCALDALVIVKK